jgi:hypothetical protein
VCELMLAPPKAGDASYPLYHQEVTGIFSSLKRRAAKVPHLAPRMLFLLSFAFSIARQLAAALNSMKNVSCTSLDGAMCALPLRPPLHPQLFSVIPLFFVSPMFLGEQVRVSQCQAAAGRHPISPGRWKGARHLVLSPHFPVCLYHTHTRSHTH